MNFFKFIVLSFLKFPKFKPNRYGYVAAWTNTPLQN